MRTIVGSKPKYSAIPAHTPPIILLLERLNFFSDIIQYLKISIYKTTVSLAHLQVKPIIHFYHERIGRGESPHTIQIMSPTRLIPTIFVRHLMLPNEVNCRSPQVFPTYHQVSTKLVETEVRVLERVLAVSHFARVAVICQH